MRPGAIETIVDALNSHPASAALQEQGCAALGNLAHAQPTNRARIVACGGPAAVVRGLSFPPPIHHFFVCPDHRLPPSFVEAGQSKRAHITHPCSAGVFDIWMLSVGAESTCK